MNNPIIELRQKDSNSKVYDEGYYEVKLNNPLDLYPGDIVQMRGCYIDTVSANANNILIKDDLIITVSVGYYLYDWFTTDKTYSNMPSAVRPSGEMYYLIGATDVQNYKGAKFSCYDASPPYDSWGGFNVTFSYLDVNNVEQEFTMLLPQKDTSVLEQDITFTPNISAIEGSMILKNPPLTTSSKTREKLNTDFVSFDTDPPAVGKKGPYVQRKSYQLAKGSYTPDQFANELTRLFSENGNKPNSNFGYDTPFLITSEDMDASFDGNGPLFLIADGKDKGASYNTTQRIQIAAGKTYWIGTNQFAVQYDQNSNKFVFSYMHMPPYDADANIVSGYQKDSANNLFPYNKNGGVYLTQFDSKYANISDSIDILQIMGFNRDTLICNVGGTDNGSMMSPLINAKNVTAQFIGIDELITKDGTYNLAKKNTPVIAESNATDEISASNQYGFDDIDEPYFLIEITSEFKTDYHSQKYNKRNISAIVSKYYSYKSFTTSGSESAVTYQHVGEPTTINAFTVRILNPDLSLAQTIGDDNTVFLEIKRLQPNLYNPPKEKKKEE